MNKNKLKTMYPKILACQYVFFQIMKKKKKYFIA